MEASSAGSSNPTASGGKAKTHQPGNRFDVALFQFHFLHGMSLCCEAGVSSIRSHVHKDQSVDHQSYRLMFCVCFLCF